MIYALAVVVGIVGAVVGWFVSGVVTLWIAGLCGMSDFEGGRGMFAFLGIAPIGGLLCMIASAWLVLHVGLGRASFGQTLVRLTIVLGAIAIVVGAGILVRLATVDTYSNTAPPVLAFEIRAPAAISLPDPHALRVELHTDKNVGEGQLAARWQPAENGYQVLAGSVPLALKTSSRLLVVFVPEQPTRLFRLSLSRDPPSTPTLGPWRRADHVDLHDGHAPRAAPTDDLVEVRYRVERADD